MKVPLEVLSVPRPTNTIVVDNGGNGANRFAVLARAGSVYRPGKGSSPRHGKVVGHIVDGSYYPKDSKERTAEPTDLDYGVSTLVKLLLSQETKELLECYNPADVYSIMALATARVKLPGVANQYVRDVYRGSFASLYWHGAAVSKNSVGSLLRRLGEDGDRRLKFYRLHVANSAVNGEVVIGGMLKQDTGKVNDLSNLSYKSRKSGCMSVSILYAFDVRRNEPICAEAFPGNCVDMASFRTFIVDNSLREGLIVVDKGFPIAEIEEELKKNPNLHYLAPLKRNDKLIKIYRLHENYDGVLPDLAEHAVFYRKVKTADGRYLYAFRNTGTLCKELIDFCDRGSHSPDFNIDDWDRRKDQFGTIDFVSDLDMDPAVAYGAYSQRWLIELAFDRYKNDLDLDITNVHGNYSVIGNEFVNFLCTLATCRIVNLARRNGVLSKMSYAVLIWELDRGFRKRRAPLDKTPKANDMYWSNPDFTNFELLVAMGLCEPENPEPRRRGRPRKLKKEPVDTSEKNEETAKGMATGIATESPKRWVGRPRKNPVVENQVKRPRGRPKKAKVEFVGPKRPVGRPRIHPLKPEGPKRPRGRPRKTAVASQEIR